MAKKKPMMKKKMMSQESPKMKKGDSAGAGAMFGKRGGELEKSVNKSKNESQYKGIEKSKDRID